MAFLTNQLDQVTAVDDAALSASVPVLPAPSAGVDDVHGRLESEERDWANLVQDAIRQIGEKLLAMDATEYFRLRAVCKPWRSSTDDNRSTWEPCFFPRNWTMLHEDEDYDEDDDDDDEALPDPAASRRRRFVNVRTGATLWIQLPSFEAYGDFLTDTEGLLLFYCSRTDTVRLFNPLTTATAVLPGFPRVPGLEQEPGFTAAGIVIDRRNTPGLEGDPIIVPNVVLVMVSGRSTMFLCAKPFDDHWETVDASIAEVDGGGVLPFEGGLSLQGHFYIPTRHGDVLRVELYPHRLVYVARPPGRAHCTCRPHDVTSYLVPSLDDASGTGENDDGMLLVRVFADDQTDVLKLHLGNGSYTPIPPLSNRTIFLPRLTLVTDRFPSLVEQGEEGSVHLNEYIEDYI